MFSLRFATYLLVGPTIAGIFVIAMLSMDMISARNIAIAAVAGAIVGIPAALVIANKINEAIRPKKG